MSRGPVTFKELDLTRALKAAKKAGVRVRVDIVPGKLTVTTLNDNEPADGEPNPWDDLYETKKPSKVR
jgi:hypothetical protein